MEGKGITIEKEGMYWYIKSTWSFHPESLSGAYTSRHAAEKALELHQAEVRRKIMITAVPAMEEVKRVQGYQKRKILTLKKAECVQ